MPLRALWQYIRGAAKGTTTEANVTATDVNGNTQALDIKVYSPQQWTVTGTSGANAAQTLTKTGAAGFSHFITGYLVTIIEAAAGADTPITLSNGATEIWRDYIVNAAAAGTRIEFTFPHDGLEIAAAANALITVGAAGAACKSVANMFGHTR